MNVTFTRVNPPGKRWREDRRRAVWSEAFASAVVDGHLVKVTPRKGWTCDCDNDECGHVDAVAELIHPRLLASLEGEDTSTPRERATA